MRRDQPGSRSWEETAQPSHQKPTNLINNRSRKPTNQMRHQGPRLRASRYASGPAGGNIQPLENGKIAWVACRNAVGIRGGCFVAGPECEPPPSQLGPIQAAAATSQASLRAEVGGVAGGPLDWRRFGCWMVDIGFIPVADGVQRTGQCTYRRIPDRIGKKAGTPMRLRITSFN